jgi:hypothetical protein
MAGVVDLADGLAAGGPQSQGSWRAGVDEGVRGQLLDCDDQITGWTRGIDLRICEHAMQSGARPCQPCAHKEGHPRRFNGIGSVAIACVTGRQLGEVVEGDVPDDFDDELGREFGGGVV